MDRKVINIIILSFVVGMASYHIIPSRFLIGRLIYFISLYGTITAFLFHLRYTSLEKKYRQFYLIASVYSISKMFYHLWVAVTAYRYGLMKIEYNFKILGVDCEVFAAVFSLILFIILIAFKFNNKNGMVKKSPDCK